MGKNAFLNGFKNVLNLLFPLLTFPYVSKILNVEESDDIILHNRQ